MAKTRMILFRVTQSQYERIQNNAQAKGHKSLASYLRYTALDKDLVFEKRFDEMYRVVVTKNRMARRGCNSENIWKKQGNINKGL